MDNYITSVDQKLIRKIIPVINTMRDYHRHKAIGLETFPRSGRLLLVSKCDLKWCKITSGDFKGWIDKNYLWGNVK